MLLSRLPSFQPWTSPYDGLEDLRREMVRMLDSWTEKSSVGAPGVFPPIEVAEKADSIVVRAEVPGVDPDDLDVRVENQTLTITGERKTPTNGDQTSVHRREREWGKFRRSLTLPFRVEADKVEARCANGILSIELPKAAEARPKQITVQAGA